MRNESDRSIASTIHPSEQVPLSRRSRNPRHHIPNRLIRLPGRHNERTLQRLGAVPIDHLLLLDERDPDPTESEQSPHETEPRLPHLRVEPRVQAALDGVGPADEGEGEEVELERRLRCVEDEDDGVPG